MTRKQIIREVYANWGKYLTSLRFAIWLIRATEAGYNKSQ